VRQRALAYVLDALALGTVAGLLAARLDRAGSRRRLLTAAIAGVLGTVYRVVPEGRGGWTPGKHVAKVAVVHADNSPCTVRGAGIRTALRAVDWLPMNHLVGTASMVLSARNQRIGDRVAGTVVVRTDAGTDTEVDESRSGGV
jgi:uncharacterized RDD family membrane protein YckC